MNRKFSIILMAAVFLGALGAWVHAQTNQVKPKVIIDPGHGGSDLGSKAGSEIEKDWNLKVALAIQKALESVGFDVILTRKEDDTLEAAKRTTAINTSNALAVLVIHADRDWTGVQNGPSLIVEPPNQIAPQETDDIQRLGAMPLAQYRSSLKLAKSIAQNLGINTSFGPLSDSRGTLGETVVPAGRIFCLPHQGLRYLIKPAVVLTPLFLTSSSDLKKYGQAENLTAFASKVAQGMADYLQIATPKPGAAVPTPPSTAVSTP